MESPPNPKEDLRTLSIQLANQIINVANTRLESGLAPEAIAEGMRHAAANFSAASVDQARMCTSVHTPNCVCARHAA